MLNNSSKPGDEPQVRIRGTRSLSAGNDSLYVIDGIPYSGSLNDIGTGVIQSMDILKDASATAIYGSRGANGVVLITTLRGRNSRPVVSYSGSYGYVKQLGEADMMNAKQFINMRREAYRTIGKYDDSNPDASDAKIFNAVEYANIKRGVDVDWQKLVVSPGYQTNHSLSVAGGTEKTKYAVGIGYFKDQGVLKLQSYERYNLNVGIDQQIGNRVRVGASLLASYSERKGETYNGIDNALKMLPIAQSVIPVSIDKDRQVLGSPEPKWQGGTTQRVSYKGIELSVVAFARIGGMIKSDFYQNYNTLFGRYNNLNIDYFTPSTPTNDFPRPNANQERPSNYQTLSYFDGSFFKIRNITLAYSLPDAIVKRMQMQSFRVNVGVKQPLILAPYRQKWKGIDPEDVNVIGVDAPATWMLQFGINARF